MYIKVIEYIPEKAETEQFYVSDLQTFISNITAYYEAKGLSVSPIRYLHPISSDIMLAIIRLCVLHHQIQTETTDQSSDKPIVSIGLDYSII